MNAVEALAKLVDYAYYLDESVPDHIWENWQEYHEENNEPLPWEGVNISEWYKIILAALAEKGETNDPS